MRQLFIRYSNPNNFLLVFLVAGLFAFTTSCTTGAKLSTSGLPDIDTAVGNDSFTLIFHSSQGLSYMDTVAILDTQNREFARGLTGYSSQELSKIKGQKTDRIKTILGYKYYDEAIHRDNLVIL